MGSSPFLHELDQNLPAGAPVKTELDRIFSAMNPSTPAAQPSPAPTPSPEPAFAPSNFNGQPILMGTGGGVDPNSMHEPFMNQQGGSVATTNPFMTGTVTPPPNQAANANAVLSFLSNGAFV